MNKLILLNTDVINIIVDAVVGSNAINQYRPARTEWTSEKRSDIIYTAKKSKALPPIIVEVQNTINESFLRRLNGYCLNAAAEYHCDPIAIVFGIGSTTKNILSNTHKSNVHPFMLQIPSFPWAKRCFIMGEATIGDFIDGNSLEPLLALTLFLIKQKQTLRECPRNDDATIRTLYRIARNLSDTQDVTLESIVKDYGDVCQESKNYMEKALEQLKKETNEEVEKRTLEVLEEGIQVIDRYSKRHKHIEDLTPPPASPPPPQEQLPSSVTGTADDNNNDAESSSRQSSSTTWSPHDTLGFIAQYQNQRDGSYIDWSDCYAKGKAEGLFAQYQNGKSLKSAYYRLKKQEQK